MLSYHVEHLGLLDTSESLIWEARSKLIIWRYIFEIPKNIPWKNGKETKTNIISTVILQIIYSRVDSSSSGCFPKKSCSQTPAQLQNSSLTEMEAPFEPRKTHEKRHFFERFCTRFGPFFQLTRFWTSKWFKHPIHEIKQNRISKPRFLCKISWSRIDLSLKNTGNNNKLTSSFHSHAISSDVPNGRNLPDMKLHSKPGQTIDNTSCRIH